MAAEVSGYVCEGHRAAVEDHIKRRAGLLHFLSREPKVADSDEAAPLFRDDCAPGFRDDLAPC
ncbi:hypothetical protein GOC09_19505, partial [Sinorhizobium meliloti]|nr:hypothetical protein [Sinorhizobium meliloti]MDW9835434.1 hypothetical protein [Sinorhizobium meliloti]MDX0039921.1 hypothetical protein [Sinorhizobium meliloti]MDX0089386.1 hypothetical protein [Sinorhizobium meliloti]